jgi:hypothetical protein
MRDEGKPKQFSVFAFLSSLIPHPSSLYKKYLVVVK